MITDTDPRIRIRIQIKMIWIRNTVIEFNFETDAFILTNALFY